MLFHGLCMKFEQFRFIEMEVKPICHKSRAGAKQRRGSAQDGKCLACQEKMRPENNTPKILIGIFTITYFQQETSSPTPQTCGRYWKGFILPATEDFQ